MHTGRAGQPGLDAGHGGGNEALRDGLTDVLPASIWAALVHSAERGRVMWACQPLATAHILWESGRLDPNQPACFDKLSGRITAVRRGDWIEMDFPLFVRRLSGKRRVIVGHTSSNAKVYLVLYLQGRLLFFSSLKESRGRRPRLSMNFSLILLPPPRRVWLRGPCFTRISFYSLGS